MCIRDSDNGAFTFWTKNKAGDWNEYYRFVERWGNHPRFSFAVIPCLLYTSLALAAVWLAADAFAEFAAAVSLVFALVSLVFAAV